MSLPINLLHVLLLRYQIPIRINLLWIKFPLTKDQYYYLKKKNNQLPNDKIRSSRIGHLLIDSCLVPKTDDKEKTSTDLIPISNSKALVSMNNSLVLDKSKSSCNNQLLNLDSVKKSLVNFETITLRKEEQLFSTKGDESIYRNDLSKKMEGATVRCFPIGMVYPNRHVMQYHVKTFANFWGFEMRVKNCHCECNKGSSKQVRKD